MQRPQTDDRPSPAVLEARYVLNQAAIAPTPKMIAIFDDMKTTGAPFVAIRNILRRLYPDVPVFGLLIARRVPETVDIEDL